MSAKHIHDGGTGITNFDSHQQALYERAIKKFGGGELYIGVPIKFEPGCGMQALHSSSGRFPNGITRFWKIFEELRLAEKARTA